MSRIHALFTWRTAIIKSTLPATTRHVLLTISCHMNEAGESSFPSTAKLAEETGLSRRCIIDQIKVAQKSGYLQVHRRKKKTGDWTSNEYFPCIPGRKGGEPAALGVVNDVHQGSEPAALPSEPAALGVVNDVHINSSVFNSSDNSSVKNNAGADKPPPAPPAAESKNGKVPWDKDTYIGKASRVLDLLNRKLGTKYPATTGNNKPSASAKLIIDRLKDGYGADDFKAVISDRLHAWQTDDKMREYLRPQTLFRASNFEQYLGQAKRESRR